MKNLLLTLTLLAFSTLASATDRQGPQSPKVEEYGYSTHLDIARVISMSDTDYCGIGPREMTYADHMGTLHILRYQAFGDGCNNQN